MTKYSEAKAVLLANAQQTANFVYEDIICRYRYSNFLISD